MIGIIIAIYLIIGLIIGFIEIYKSDKCSAEIIFDIFCWSLYIILGISYFVATLFVTIYDKVAYRSIPYLDNILYNIRKDKDSTKEK